jgi:hypothetical protein
LVFLDLAPQRHPINTQNVRRAGGIMTVLFLVVTIAVMALVF